MSEEIKSSIQNYFPEFNFPDIDLLNRLSEYLDHLIVHDFQKLVYLLYRMDISEKKLQKLINEPSEKTAGQIIAQMIIEREAQKIESRKNFKPDNAASDEEKW